ncbi:hypothetical protein [Agromyces sp. NPDC055661]
MNHQHDEDSDWLSRRLAAAGHVKLSALADEAAESLTRLLEDPSVRASLDLEGSRRSLTSRTKAIVALASAVLAVGVGIAAPAVALATFAAQTGRFGDPATSTEEDATEWLDLSASDLPEAVAAAYPRGLQLPPSVDRTLALTKVQSIFDRFAAEGGQAQSGLATTTFEFWATCAWTNEWLIADDLGDDGRREHATAWLHDPKNYPSIVANDGGGLVEQLLAFADGAAQGDRDAVEQAYRFGNCADLLEATQ